MATEPRFPSTFLLDGADPKAADFKGSSNGGGSQPLVPFIAFFEQGIRGESASFSKPHIIAPARFTVEAANISLWFGASQAAHASNYWDIRLYNDTQSLVIASWSTQSTAEGAIAADSLNDMTLSATGSDRIVAANDVVTIDAVKNGTPANLLYLMVTWQAVV